MARKRRQQDEARDDATMDGALPAIPSDEPSRVDEQTERDIDDVLLEVGSAAIVKISRVNPDTGNAQYVGQMKGEDFSLDALADVYGGGRYVLRVLDGKEIVSKVPVEIDSAIPPRNPRAPRGQPQQNNPNDLLTAILAGQAESNRRTMEMMTTMMAGVTQMMTSMVAVRREAQPDQPNPLEMLKTAADIMRPTTPARSAISELKELMELREIMQPDSPQDDGTLRVVEKAIGAVSEIARRAPSPQPPRPRPVQPPTAAAAALPVPEQPSPEETNVPDIMRPWMKAVLPHMPLLRMSLGNLSPGVAADIIVDKLGDEEFGDLVTDMTDGLQTGQEVTAETMRPFAERVVTVLQLPVEHVEWLASVAVELMVIANDELGEDEAGDDKPKPEGGA